MILRILGIPKPKQGDSSGIITTKTGKQFVHHYQKTEVKNEANNLRAQIVQQLPEDFKPFSGLIRVNKLHFIFPVLKTMSKKQLELVKNGGLIYKGSRPDLDNLQKALWDAMNGVVFTDDKNIVEILDVKKYYGFRPMIIIDIGEITMTGLNKVEQFVHRFLILSEEEKQTILTQLIGDN